MRFYYVLLIVVVLFRKLDLKLALTSPSYRMVRGVGNLLLFCFVESSKRRWLVEFPIPFRYRPLRLLDRLSPFRIGKLIRQTWRRQEGIRMVLYQWGSVLLRRVGYFVRISSDCYWSRCFDLLIVVVRSNRQRSSVGYLWFRGMKELWRVTANRLEQS
jgi:hypothetical protein